MKNKMTNCKVCGKEQRNFFAKHKILTGVIVVIILAVFGGSSGGKTSQPVQEDQNTNVEVSKTKMLKRKLTYQ